MDAFICIGCEEIFEGEGWTDGDDIDGFPTGICPDCLDEASSGNDLTEA